jgi:crossover junction endodeoxyribonuclease RuvC
MEIWYAGFMRIIAIDPGYDRVGVAILERNLPDRENVIFSTCITTNKKDEFYDRLKVVQEKVADIVATYSPEILAIEELYLQKIQQQHSVSQKLAG